MNKPSRLDPLTYRPMSGDRFSFAPPGMYPFDIVIGAVERGEAEVRRASVGQAPDPGGTFMPAASVAHFVNDLQAQVVAPLGADPLVNAVIRGEAEFLGKGDDGLVFRVGSNAVKVSTTVPYQPFNTHHLTPQQAAQRLAEQQATSEAMRLDGVPGILPSRFVMQGDKGFMIRPYVELVPLDREQLESVAESVERAHALGWVFRDAIQVGELDGGLFHYDTGKAQRLVDAAAGDPFSPIVVDEGALRALFNTYGQVYIAPTERENPQEEFEEALWHTDPEGMSAEALSEHRRLLLKLRTKLEAFMRKHPDHPTTDFWGDRDFRASQFRENMERFGWAPQR